MLADLDDADNLQAFRLQLGLTQEEMAELLALVAWERFRERAAPNANMVSKWERGMKAPGKLYRRCFRLLSIAIPDELDAYLTRLGCDTVEAMNRRQALGVAAALGAAVALPEQLFNSAVQNQRSHRKSPGSATSSYAMKQPRRATEAPVSSATWRGFTETSMPRGAPSRARITHSSARCFLG
jgi:transcriptional regulator with XRE-family HTH domain